MPCPSSASGKRESLDGLSRSVEGEDNPALLINDIVISTLPYETFIVYGRVHGADVRFLVDTGAAVSLLNSTVWRKLTADASLRLEPWLGARLVGVDGSQLRVFGQAPTSTCNWNSNYFDVGSGCRRTDDRRNTRDGLS